MTDPRPLPVAATRADLRDHLAAARADGVVLVPTMGALHEGHATLIRAARDLRRGPVVVSIFVNPTQFAPGEDFERYPRTLDADLALARAAGADLAFAPSVEEVYPGGDPQVTVDPGPLGSVLEGASRPTHFRGVLTVVAKLLGLVRPDVAVFGEKDYQQLTLIRRMCADLCLGVEALGVETVRESDGLALSSRNRYLAPDERERASVLNRALRAAVEHAPQGPDAARAAALEVLAEEPLVTLDYLALTTADLDDLPTRPAPGTPGRALVAARLGPTRLIDNLPVRF